MNNLGWHKILHQDCILFFCISKIMASMSPKFKANLVFLSWISSFLSSWISEEHFLFFFMFTASAGYSLSLSILYFYLFLLFGGWYFWNNLIWEHEILSSRSEDLAVELNMNGWFWISYWSSLRLSFQIIIY